MWRHCCPGNLNLTCIVSQLQWFLNTQCSKCDDSSTFACKILNVVFIVQKTHLNSNLELQLQTVGGWNSTSRPSTRTGPMSEGGASQDFKSCFARTLDVNGTDRITWLEKVMLDT